MRSQTVYIMADSMRVGKTTAVKVVADGLRKEGYKVTESYEDWQHNPYLQQSYADPERNFLDSQKWFARRKWEQVKEGGKGVFIQDVAPEMDYNYAETNRRLGRMSEAHFAEYEQYYRSLDWESVKKPSLLVYLQVTDEGLIRRAIDSAREFEKVEPEYFLMMKRVNREWLVGARERYNVVEVDTDQWDFAHDEVAKHELVQTVLNRL